MPKKMFAESFLYARRRDSIRHVATWMLVAAIIVGFLYARRRDSIRHTSIIAFLTIIGLSFYTPVGVTPFGTSLVDPSTSAAVRFLYARRRDSIRHLPLLLVSQPAVRFYTPVGVTPFGTLRNLIMTQIAIPSFYTPVGVTPFGTTGSCVSPSGTTVSIRPSA